MGSFCTTEPYTNSDYATSFKNAVTLQPDDEEDLDGDISVPGVEVGDPSTLDEPVRETVVSQLQSFNFVDNS